MRFINSVKEEINFNVENQNYLRISGKYLKLSVALPKEIKKYTVTCYSLFSYLHKKWNFPLRISSVSVTKTAVYYGWSHSLKKSLIGNFIFCAQFSSNEDGVQVIIVHPLTLTQIIAVIGWIYFLAWSVSF